MSYSSEVKIIRGSQGDIETEIEEYLATVTSGNVYFFNCSRYGADQLIVTIVHDA